MFKPGYIFEKIIYRLLLVSGWKRDVVQANLNFVHSNPSKVIYTKEYKQIISNLSRHVSEILFDFGSFKRLSQDFSSYPFKQNLITYKLADGSEPVLDKMRKGGIFLTAHYGNYEAIGPWLCRLDIPLKASYIPLKPAVLNRIVENRIRSVDKVNYSVNAKNPREFLRLLDEKKLFCLLMDQDSRIESAATSTFLGKKVHVNPLPDFLLRHRPETPVFICWLEETASEKILHATEITPTGNSVNEAFNHWLEKRIAEKPALWYGWTHRRFYSCNPEIYSKLE
ncbi:KDO2-lipid IV(A) lauroyltransferase [Fibrobacter sp. UWT2]|uniref:lysophospholipid acyltransferase family protein n=1 Tax=Fibrobacter sp. UWT2 TaxID=1896224 RepID=UPI000911850D|nr:lysophospholipid acyltransferase family protein [Fibrobacter sp. UWT2]SHL47434.1 KDO2-lipid IV(A) lauroyltransferase [Fibrobacter sp. UWT2]